MKRPHSSMFLRRRKFFLFLPLLVLPFVVFAFWVFGDRLSGDTSRVASSTGINTRLPDAQLEKDPLDKLAYYERSDIDSFRFQERIKRDPFAREDSASPERVAHRQLQDLEKAMASELRASSAAKPASRFVSRSMPRGDVDRLEGLMQEMKEKPQRDPEISLLDSLMDKIIAVQYPAAVRTTQPAERTFRVEPVSPGDVQISDSTEHVFFDFHDTAVVGDRMLIKAMVENRQSIIPGSIVLLRLQETVSVADVSLPNGHLLSGVCSINNDRLQIRVASVAFGSRWLPVSLTVLDLDGVEGIYVPNPVAAQSLKQSGVRSLSGLNNIGSAGQQAAAKLATAGIEAGKNLLTKRARQIRVTVPAGYQVLLMNHSK